MRVESRRVTGVVRNLNGESETQPYFYKKRGCMKRKWGTLDERCHLTSAESTGARSRTTSTRTERKGDHPTASPHSDSKLLGQILDLASSCAPPNELFLRNFFGLEDAVVCMRKAEARDYGVPVSSYATTALKRRIKTNREMEISIPPVSTVPLLSTM